MSEHLRAARPHEREALEALQLQASLMWEEDRAALLANLDAIDLPPQQITDGDVFVCESGGEIVGFGVVLRRDDGQAELDGLFVKPDVWGEGFGRLLLEHGAALAKDRGATTLHVILSGLRLRGGRRGDDAVQTSDDDGQGALSQGRRRAMAIPVWATSQA
jgi:GNAT superfamily N-acetyltransferase